MTYSTNRPRREALARLPDRCYRAQVPARHRRPVRGGASIRITAPASSRLRRVACLGLLLASGCRSVPAGGPTVVTLPGSMLGAEGTVLRRQLARFMADHPEIHVVQRATPDAADQRHQLYVQWLNARASQPDILQLDAIWTPEFAAAGWILDLDRFRPATDAFFPATVTANSWRGRLYAMPWFVDVGMLYWRTDLMDAPPATFQELDGSRSVPGPSGASATAWCGRAPATRGSSRCSPSTSVATAAASSTGSGWRSGRAPRCGRSRRCATRSTASAIVPQNDADLARGGVAVRLPERRDGVHGSARPTRIR